MTPDLVLIACSKAKAKLEPGEVRSPRALYGPSALFRGAVRSAERRGIPWAVLSARHGFVTPVDALAPYDETLSDLSGVERRAWAERVVGKMVELGYLRSAVRGVLRADKPGTRIEIHAGALYADPLVPLLLARGASVTEPLRGLGIGRRLGWYKAADEAAATAAPVGRTTIDLGEIDRLLGLGRRS